MSYYPSPPPTSTSKPQQLVSWLRREFTAVASGFTTIWDIPVTSQAPEKAVEGSLRYADGVSWNPNSGKGLYVYDGTAWVKL